MRTSAARKLVGGLYRAKMRLKGIPSLRGVAKSMRKKRLWVREAKDRYLASSDKPVTQIVPDLKFVESLSNIRFRKKPSKRDAFIAKQMAILRKQQYRIGD